MTSLAPDCPAANAASKSPRYGLCLGTPDRTCSEVEVEVRAVAGSLGAQSDVVTHSGYTGQGLRPHSQEENPE